MSTSFVKTLRFLPLLLAISFLAADVAHAACKEGTIRSCKIGGKPGTQECVSGQWTPCVPGEEPPKTGTLHPKYYILLVVYAPPGTKGGGSIISSVIYGSGSTAGSTVSASDSFKQAYSVSVTASGGILADAKVGASFGYSRNSTDSHSLDITKSTSTKITAYGPSIDGIDHDRDQIWLWLNPSIRLSLGEDTALWTVQDTARADIQFVYVRDLKDPSKMPPGVADRLKVYGITAEEYPEILKADPFAYGSPVADPQRFPYLNTTFPYEPPYAEGDPPVTLEQNITNNEVTCGSQTVEVESKVGLTISAGVSFTSLFETSVKEENSWTWTNTNTNKTCAGTSQSATVLVAGPSYGYTGPTDMGVYYDTVYKTFYFAPVQGRLRLFLKGIIKSRSGQRVNAKEVIIVANGKRYRTLTNRKGEYRVFGNVSGPVRLQVDSVTRRIQVPKQQIPSVADIELP